MNYLNFFLGNSNTTLDPEYVSDVNIISSIMCKVN